MYEKFIKLGFREDHARVLANRDWILPKPEAYVKVLLEHVRKRINKDQKLNPHLVVLKILGHGRREEAHVLQKKFGVRYIDGQPVPWARVSKRDRERMTPMLTESGFSPAQITYLLGENTRGGKRGKIQFVDDWKHRRAGHLLMELDGIRDNPEMLIDSPPLAEKWLEQFRINQFRSKGDDEALRWLFCSQYRQPGMTVR